MKKIPISRLRAPLLTLSLLLTAAAASAQVATPPGMWVSPPANVVQLSASGSVDVQQDLLVIAMSTTREGTDAATVQSQLKAALEAALQEAKKQAQPGLMEVRTGNFGLHPRYSREGKINGWQGTVELVLEGRDFSRITAAAGKIQSLAVANVSFRLSREQQAKVEGEARAQAVERFNAKAADVSRLFGFAGFTLREVNVEANEQGMPGPRMMAVQAKGLVMDSPIPVEAGKSTVQVTVSGTVQMSK